MPRSFDDTIIHREIYNLCNCVVIANNTQLGIDCKVERNVSNSCQEMTLHGCCERSLLPVIRDGVTHSRVLLKSSKVHFETSVDHGLECIDGRGVCGDSQFYCPCSLSCWLCTQTVENGDGSCLLFVWAAV